MSFKPLFPSGVQPDTATTTTTTPTTAPTFAPPALFPSALTSESACVSARVVSSSSSTYQVPHANTNGGNPSGNGDSSDDGSNSGSESESESDSDDVRSSEKQIKKSRKLKHKHKSKSKSKSKHKEKEKEKDKKRKEGKKRKHSKHSKHSKRDDSVSDDSREKSRNKSKRYKSTYSDQRDSFSSESDDDMGDYNHRHRGRDHSSVDSNYRNDRNDKQSLEKLYLPNGQFIFTDEYESSRLQGPGDIAWNMNREGDYSVLQFGSYRLDVPSYDLYLPSQGRAQSSGSKFVTSDRLAKSNHHLPEGLQESAPKTKQKNKPDDDTKCSKNLRYYNQRNHSGDSPTSNPIYRLWMKEKGLPNLVTAVNGAQHGMLVFPPPLPELQETYQLPSTSKGISSNIIQPRKDVLTAENFSTFGNREYDETLVQACMKTDEQLLQQTVSSLSQVCRTEHDALCKEADSPAHQTTLAVDNSELCDRFKFVYRWLDLAKKSGELLSLQLLLSTGQISSSSQKNQHTLTSHQILSKRVEKEYDVLRECVTKYINRSEWLPLIYQALLYNVNVMRKLTPLDSTLYAGDFPLLSYSTIWTQVLQNCPLNSHLRHMYVPYDMLKFVWNDSGKNTSIVYSSFYRSVLSKEQQSEKIVAGIKNRNAAMRMWNLSSTDFMSTSGHASQSSPEQTVSPRLQEDVDCFQVGTLVQLCTQEEIGDHSERKFSLIQAALEINLGVYPSALLAIAKTTEGADCLLSDGLAPFSKCIKEEETVVVALQEFEAYWESEYVRIGEDNGKSPWGGYTRWVLAGRPLDGWEASNSGTGQPAESDKSELTPAEYLNSVQKFVAKFKESTMCTSLADVNSEEVMSSCIEESNCSLTEVVTSLPDPVRHLQIAKGLDDTGGEAEGEDEFIYSAVHGYRIKVPAMKKGQKDGSDEEYNLETLAYKKILGDIKEEDLTDMSAAAILKRYKLSEAGNAADKFLTKPLGSHTRLKQQCRHETLLSLLQWRPLRVNAASDLEAAAEQPDRVVFKEDLVPHVFIVHSRKGREMLVMETLQLLGIQSTALMHSSATGHHSSCLTSCHVKQPLHYLSGYWQDIVNQFGADNKGEFFTILESIIHMTYASGERHSKEETIILDGHHKVRSQDLLYSLNNSCGDFAGLTIDSLGDLDAVGMVLKPELIYKHVACALLDLSSPLTAVISIVKQIIQIQVTLHDQFSQLNGAVAQQGGYHSSLYNSHLLKTQGLLSSSVCVLLKSCLLKLLHARSHLDRKVAAWRCHHISVTAASAVEKIPTALDVASDFQTACQEFLSREESSISPDIGYNFEVWNTYAQSEIMLGNISQARKVCSRSLVALASNASRETKDREQLLTRLCATTVKGTSVTLETYLREKLLSIVKDTITPPSSGIVDLIQLNSEIALWKNLLSLSCGMSGGLELYQMTLQLFLKPSFTFSSGGKVNEKTSSSSSSVPTFDKNGKQVALRGGILLLLQLSDGGVFTVPELESEFNTILKDKGKKTKKNRPLISESEITADTRATCGFKLEAMVQGLWSLVETSIEQEREKQMTEIDIDAIRLQGNAKPGYTSTAFTHTTSLLHGVGLLAWWTFLSAQYQLTSTNSIGTDSHKNICGCAINIFDKWISKVLDLLLMKSNATSSTLPSTGTKDKQSKYSRFFNNLSGASANPMSTEHMSVFEVLHSCSGKGSGIWMSSEEQGLVSCLEKLYLKRVHFSILIMTKWSDSSIVSSSPFYLQECRAIIRKQVLDGLHDFPMNDALNHVLLSMDLASDNLFHNSDVTGISRLRAAGSKVALRKYIDKVTGKLSMWGLHGFGHMLQLCVLITEGFESMSHSLSASESCTELTDLVRTHPECTHWSEDTLMKLFAFLDSVLLPQIPGSPINGTLRHLSQSISSSAMEDIRLKYFSTSTMKNDFIPCQASVTNDNNSHLHSSPMGIQCVYMWRIYVKFMAKELQSKIGLQKKMPPSTVSKSFSPHPQPRSLHFRTSLKRRLLRLFSASHQGGGYPLLSLQSQDISAASACFPFKSFWIQETGIVDLVFMQLQLMEKRPDDGCQLESEVCDRLAEELGNDFEEKISRCGFIARSV